MRSVAYKEAMSYALDVLKAVKESGYEMDYPLEQFVNVSVSIGANLASAESCNNPEEKAEQYKEAGRNACRSIYWGDLLYHLDEYDRISFESLGIKCERLYEMLKSGNSENDILPEDIEGPAESDDLSNLFDSDIELNQGFFDEADEIADLSREWHPRFPVNMDEPVELTPEQKERALKIYESISAHLDAYPDDHHAPLICITQDWRVRVDFGGWNSDSDYRDMATCVMCRDEEGWYLSLDYVEQCVPFIENELKDRADKCKKMYGEVPDHHEADTQRVVAAEMELLSILSDPAMREFGFDDVLIAMDTIEHTIYPMPANMEHDDYGGIIQYIPANTLVSEDGTIDLDRVKKLVNDFINPI